MSQRQQDKEQIGKIDAMLASLAEQKVRITFGPSQHSFTSTFIGVRQSRLADLINTPDRRERDGIWYTPTTVTFVFESGKLHFVLEDITRISQNLKGVCVITGPTEVRMELCT